ncbi:MAG: hypothetical protein UIJ87_05160, partial [Anaerovoracaceae bacterium]|nr:hypothetical protein [Anaerovoracaceae bacterium]
HTSRCTSTIETAVYENRTYGGVRGRRLVTASYSISAFSLKLAFTDKIQPAFREYIIDVYE